MLCCCCLPSPVTCLIIGLVFLCMSVYALVEDVDSLKHDQGPVQFSCVAFHLVQTLAGFCIVISVVRQYPSLLRASAVVVGVSGVFYFVEVLVIQSIPGTANLIWACLAIAIYIYLASILCASAGIMEMVWSGDDMSVVWYTPYYNHVEGEPGPGGRRSGSMGPIEWFFVPTHPHAAPQAGAAGTNENASRPVTS